LRAFRRQGTDLDESLAVVVDLDKTILGPRGRNDRTIDEARTVAGCEVARTALGVRFSEQTFGHIYGELQQARYHFFTEDNQDFLVYVSLLLAAGVYDLQTLLHDLHRATGLVVHLAILDGADVVYLEKIGDRMIAAIPTRVGGRQPAHCAAVGKAMLAYNEQPDFVDLSSRKTKYSISTPAQLTAELAKVRAHGVAFDREETLPGFGCVAAPIGGQGEAVAAVSVCGPMSRMMFDQRLAAPVRMTAMGIWRNVEDGPRRVAPTLQQVRPLRGGPALRPVPVRELQYA
jgi:hypothetical protein